MIDTGAAVSVLPKSCANGISGADSLPLVAANNSTIKTYGNYKRVVDVGLKREYPWTFIVADVQQPIIGADFLIHYNLLVDLRSRCLRDMRTGLAIAASLSSIKPLSLNRVNTVRNEYTKLLGQFPELTLPTTKGEPVKHGITHKIVTKGHPVFARPRRLAPDKLVTAKREFDDGGVWQQFLNGMWQPLSFFSKKLNPAETRYSAFDRELLAVYATIKHFRHNLEGRNFFVNTDHKPLTFVMSPVTERASL